MACHLRRMPRVGVLAAVVALSVSCWGAETAPTCRTVKKTEEDRLVAYVAKKYSVPESVTLTIQSSAAVSDDCHLKIVFGGAGPLGNFSLTLYASPDLRFLSRDLMDSNADPVYERQKKARELMSKLTDGEFASRGPSNAPVTVVVFSDFQCPYCKKMAELLNDEPMVREGTKVRVIFRHYPLSQHRWAQEAALGAACAQFQSEEAFWTFHNALSSEQSGINEIDATAKIMRIANGVKGLDQGKFHECLDRQMSLGIVLRDKQLGDQVGVTATPTVFINGVLADGLDDKNRLHAAIANEATAALPKPYAEYAPSEDMKSANNKASSLHKDVVRVF